MSKRERILKLLVDLRKARLERDQALRSLERERAANGILRASLEAIAGRAPDAITADIAKLRGDARRCGYEAQP